MHPYKQMISSLGDLLSFVEVHDLDGNPVVICRWRYDGRRLEMRYTNALRVGMNLGGAFKGRHTGAGRVVDITGLPGAMGMFAPGALCETTGEGRLDVLEAFIDVRGLGHSPGEWSGLPPLDIEDESMRVALVKLLVTAQGGDEIDARDAATSLRRAAWRSLKVRSQRGYDRGPWKGGLRPTAHHRVELLIQQQLRSGALGRSGDTLPERRCLPNVATLAEAAGLSVSHFIRTFRQMTGTTPHQHVMARRQQRAMALLVEPDLSVAEVADRLGFSSPAHFVATFRTRFGVTPGGYRSAVLG